MAPVDPDGPKPRKPRLDVLVLTELEQIKVLADPLRIRILEQLAEARTTKQVAKLIGEKPTKLYHHMESLERVGLIELTHTRPNRGTLEKYYQAVACSFRADAAAFAGESGSIDEKKGALRQVAGTIFQSTAAELDALIDQGDAESIAETIEEEGLLTFLEVRAASKDIAELRRRLEETVTWLSSLDDPAAGEEEATERFRLTIAFFPQKPRKRKKDGAGGPGRAPA